MNTVRTDQNNPLWAELIQLVPVIVLAISFITSGSFDLTHAGPLFGAAAVLSAPITALVLQRGHLLNPILAGTTLWLWLGTAAFEAPLPALASWLAELRAVGLFGAAFGAGLIATALSPWGYVGCRADLATVRRASLVLLAITALVIAWSWHFRADPRLGGGLPFIVLNVSRRLLVLIARSGKCSS